jgi:hypothetical protein
VTGSESMGGNDRERPPIHRITSMDSSTTTPALLEKTWDKH